MILFGNRVIADVIKSALIGRGKFGNRHTGRIPCRDRDTQTQKEGSHVKMEAEIGGMLPQTKGRLGLVEAG